MRAETHQAEPITYAEWLEILAEHRSSMSELEIRRHSGRYQTQGDATVSFIPIQGDSSKPVSICARVMDISRLGLMLLCPYEMPRTPVNMDLRLGERHLHLRGRVMHATGTVGGFKVGVELVFEDAPEESEPRPTVYHPEVPAAAPQPASKLETKAESSVATRLGSGFTVSTQSPVALLGDRSVPWPTLSRYMLESWLGALLFVLYVCAISYVVGDILIRASKH